jgi:hypothetical protein
LGQPREIKPTEGAAGEVVLVTVPLYRGFDHAVSPCMQLFN